MKHTTLVLALLVVMSPFVVGGRLPPTASELKTIEDFQAWLKAAEPRLTAKGVSNARSVATRLSTLKLQFKPTPADPVNCQISAPVCTTSWNACEVTNTQSGTETCVSTVVIPPSGGGADCPPLSSSRTVSQACVYVPPNIWGCTVSLPNAEFSTVAAAVAAAAPNAVICVPAGTAHWASTLYLNKVVQLRAAGPGGVVFNDSGGWSDALVTIGTGFKSFPVQSGLKITVGETLTAMNIDYEGNLWMRGKVSSYVGTDLVLDVTETGGTGAWKDWVFLRPAVTTIINDAVSNYGVGMIEITEQTTGSVSVSGFKFDDGTATLGDHIAVTPVSGGVPVLLYNNWYEMNTSLGGGVYFRGNRGVVWGSSFTGRLCSAQGRTCNIGLSHGVSINSESLTSSWTTPSKWGMADAEGNQSVFIESSYFLSFPQSSSDLGSGARMVTRYNVYNHTQMASHGADTSNLGMRSAEIYSNRFHFTAPDGNGGETYNIQFYIQARGGTMVIKGNTMDNINSQYYGDKHEIDFQSQNTRRNSGPNPCWGYNIPGVQYPLPRQVGLGFVTGAGKDGLGRTNDSITYVGDSEPSYIWGNSGSPVTELSEYGGLECGSGAYDALADYIQLGRDYFFTPKPGYVEFTYPHPLRAGR